MNKKVHGKWSFVITSQVSKYSTNFSHFINSNVHDRVHKSPPRVPILSQIKTAHTFIFSIKNIYFNIIIPPTSIFSRVLPTNPVSIYLLITQTACRYPTNPITFWAVQITKLLTELFCLAPVTSFCLLTYLIWTLVWMSESQPGFCGYRYGLQWLP